MGGGQLAREEGQGWKKAREEGCLGARETGEMRAGRQEPGFPASEQKMEIRI